MDGLDDCDLQSDLSDSDGDLDELNFPNIFSKRSSDAALPHKEAEQNSSPQKGNRLDDLLSEHVKEKAEASRLEKVREELLQDLQKDSQDDLHSHSQSLASEHEDHLQQLDVKSSEPLVQPGNNLFRKEKVCSLYSERLSPLAYGYTQPSSAIDKMIASTVPETLTHLLLSKALVTCVSQISHVDSVLIWLLNILAVHSSPVTARSCYNNLIGVLHQYKMVSLDTENNAQRCWCPHPLAVMRIFVNLGADPQDILGRYCHYSKHEISKYLIVENEKNLVNQQIAEGHLCKENIHMVFKVLATTLRMQSHLHKEELNQMFFMLAKVELDTHVNRSISLEAQECFSAILQSYSKGDWPGVVPSLCKQLYEVSDHHHNQVHLADLMPGSSRGTFLQVRLSYTCLRALLMPGEEGLGDQEILHFKLADIANFRCTSDRPPISALARSLRSLLEKDMYMTMSAIKLLDMCVGDDLYRSTQPWQTMDYLINQANVVIRSIKDNISAMDLSKIKDALSNLKFKWSLSLQDHHSNQRSILPWLAITGQETIRQEVLRTNCSLMDDDLDF